MPKLLLPILRLVAWIAIAASLVYMAFFKDSVTASKGAQQPSVQLDSPSITPVKGSITNLVTVDAQVVADTAGSVKSTAGGKVGEVKVSTGQAVNAGDVLFTVKVTEEAPAGSATNTAEGAAAPTTTTKTEVVKSTSAGVIGSLDVLPGQDISIGTVAATINTGSLSVTATLGPENQYRLPQLPGSASVAVTGGPAPFECTNLHIVQPKPQGTGASSGEDQQASANPSGGPQMTCNVPTGTPIYAGASAKMEISAGSANDVLTLPITAVQGSVGKGRVWVVGQDGVETPTDVELGLTDGSMVEVKSGIDESTQVLEFVPVQQDSAAQQGPFGGSGG